MCRAYLNWSENIITYLSILILFFLIGCSSNNKNERFTLLSSDHTKINFENRVENTEEFNALNFLYFYDGGGVAVGDINNDGLPDIYFTANILQNKLYLNKGGFVFEDITKSAGVGGDTSGWSTGVTMADVNGDGYLDIYISRDNYLNKSGANQLFINNKNNTFTESAADYGIDFKGNSTQAAFFDYNNDGALDLFLLNHTFHSKNSYGKEAESLGFNLANSLRNIKDPHSGDRLFRNNRDRFVDVTEESGIYSSGLGYGLGIAISDINKDGWADIYVGNDFHEDDYLYINNGDGTFDEALASSIGHTSSSSMGNDIGDLTNDGYVDIVSLDMLPEDDTVFKQSGDPDLHVVSEIKLGFGFKPQYMHNTLQVNRGHNRDDTPLFSETSFASGIAATDWSWAPLIMDIDNDGLKDLFITNGIVRRPNDHDFYKLKQSEEIQRSLSQGISQNDLKLIEEMPPVKISNYAYRNNGDLTFTNKAKEWGLSQPSFSNGAAYADLNNNGKLDIIVNNVNMPAFIYRNNTTVEEGAHYLKIKLSGIDLNTSGIGAKVVLYKGDQIFYQEQVPTRGFQSSVDHILHFGLGDISRIDSMTVIWTDRSYQTWNDIQTNQLLHIKQTEASGDFNYNQLHRSFDHPFLRDVTEEVELDYVHRENTYREFKRQPLLPYSLSTLGPALARGDVNGDGLDDIFIGGAHGQAGVLLIQKRDGSFITSNIELFENDKISEDVSAVFFDANNDGLQDLYVVSGGNELSGNHKALKDRLYLNKGDGRYLKAEDNIPDFFENGSVVAAGDYNGDNYVDLFVGSSTLSMNYGVSPKSYLLKNDGTGKFTDVTDSLAPELREAGMITDASWAPMTNSDYPDLVIAGKWMPVSLFKNNGQSLKSVTNEANLGGTSGLWTSLLIDDITGNGKPDILAGNFGHNSRLQTSSEHPLRLYTQDFEGTGQNTSILARYEDGDYYPFESFDELSYQFRSLNSINSYAEYSTKTIEDLFGRNVVSEAQIKEINTLSSIFIENRGDGTFTIKELPLEAQIFPVMAMYSYDFNRDGNKDILMAGNLFGVKPSIGGRQDAGYGLSLKGDGNGNFKPMDLQASGFHVVGEARGIVPLLSSVGDTLIMVAKNNQSIQFFSINE